MSVVPKWVDRWVDRWGRLVLDRQHPIHPLLEARHNPYHLPELLLVYNKGGKRHRLAEEGCNHPSVPFLRHLRQEALVPPLHLGARRRHQRLVAAHARGPRAVAAVVALGRRHAA